MSSGHGESKSSGILLLIIGILLIGALIGIFFPSGFKKKTAYTPAIDKMGLVLGQETLPTDQRETDAYYTKANIDKNICGIKIFSPLPGQKVSFPIEVSGYVNGCNWVPFEGQVGTLEIRDKNKALSRLIILPVDGDSYTLPAYFKIKVTPEFNIESNDGVFIFHNEDPSGEKPETFQIPVVY